ncbi:MAG TPA: flagellar hook-basal body complex protein FliE [Ramlibacter sp.]|nr:flagellar hook-basal body complex protein FliE [Ramlibacter sp.]
MSWQAIQAQASIGAIGGARTEAAFGVDDEVAPMRPQLAAPPGGGFGQIVSDGLGGLNAQLAASQVELQRLATGEAQNLHQVMMNLEETRLSFQLFMQVRNRLLEAYQDVMKMQV